MAILLNENTTVMVQGITGQKGQIATKDMLAYGTKVVCGVTPGKGGQEVEGLPVYNTIAEAKAQHDIAVSVIMVPPLRVKGAAVEAIAAGIPLLTIISEGVPMHDTAYIIAKAKEQGVMIIGPASVGVISPGKAMIGLMGSKTSYKPGNVGVISKSGGMSSETSRILSNAGLGQSTVIGIGGDVLIGSTFVDLLEQFEQDPETKVVVFFGEIGGTYEEEMATMVKEGRFTKPIVGFISGQFAESLKHIALGHAGAIVEGKRSTRAYKMQVLQDAGVHVVEVHHKIVDKVKELI